MFDRWVAHRALGLKDGRQGTLVQIQRRFKRDVLSSLGRRSIFEIKPLTCLSCAPSSMVTGSSTHTPLLHWQSSPPLQWSVHTSSPCLSLVAMKGSIGSWFSLHGSVAASRPLPSETEPYRPRSFWKSCVKQVPRTDAGSSRSKTTSK